MFSTDSLRRFGSLLSRQHYGLAPKEQEDAEDVDDVLQMGGNVTLDCRSGKIQYLLRSRTPSDRPTVQQVMETDRS